MSSKSSEFCKKNYKNILVFFLHSSTSTPHTEVRLQPVVIWTQDVKINVFSQTSKLPSQSFRSVFRNMALVCKCRTWNKRRD